MSLMNMSEWTYGGENFFKHPWYTFIYKGKLYWCLFKLDAPKIAWGTDGQAVCKRILDRDDTSIFLDGMPCPQWVLYLLCSIDEYTGENTE